MGLLLLILMITRFLEMQQFGGQVYQPARRTCSFHLQGRALAILSRRPRQSESPKRRFVTTETRDVTIQESSSMALCCVFLFSVHATCHTHLIRLELVILLVFVQDHASGNSHFTMFLHRPITSYRLDANKS